MRKYFLGCNYLQNVHFWEVPEVDMNGLAFLEAVES